MLVLRLGLGLGAGLGFELGLRLRSGLGLGLFHIFVSYCRSKNMAREIEVIIICRVLGSCLGVVLSIS